MPELRTDWLSGRTVLVAENRALRPNEFDNGQTTGEAASAIAESATTNANCPFCAGNESCTPQAVFQSVDERGQWRVRVVPNMFPAVELHAADGCSNPATGAHEVIIETARHVKQMSSLTTSEIAHVLDAYAERLRYWNEAQPFRYGLVFKNQGPRAGASLAHVHSQLIAVPDVPPAVQRELERAKADLEQHQSCAYCRLGQRERDEGSRVVLDRDGFIAFCPYASLQPLEVWLQPVEHEPWFERPLRADATRRLANILVILFGKLESLVPDAAFNLLVRTGPWQRDVEKYYHWRIELLPRFNALAGLELATGVHINPLSPERAAAKLRPI